MENIMQFDELAVRHNAAMSAYLSMFEARTPRPQKEQVSRDIVSFITMIALAIVMVAAVIVSSSRTIDEFGGGAIGATAFVMVEGGIMAYAFFRARRNANKTRLQNTVRWATAGLILTFVVGLGANTDATMKYLGIELPTWINTSIHVLVAISAPTLAFISSDVLAIELMATDIKRREAEESYKAALEEWWAAFTRSWSAQQKNWGVKVEMQPQKQLEIDVNLRKLTAIDRPSPKLKIALEWLRAHPEHVDTESRKLGGMIGVSHTLANEARKIVKSEIEV